MIPLMICSVIALGVILERALRLRAASLGTAGLGERLVSALRNGGPAQALALTRSEPTVLGRMYEPAFRRWQEPRPTIEKTVEDAGNRELRSLVGSLRPLTVIAVLAPLLGLLGTVIGIIIAFHAIALSNAMGKPEALSSGIAQALVTTATGLALAIPAQAAYYLFRAKIDRFTRRVEEVGEELLALHGAPPLAPPAREGILTPPGVVPDVSAAFAPAASPQV